METVLLLDPETRRALAVFLLDRLAIRPEMIPLSEWRAYLRADLGAVPIRYLTALFDANDASFGGGLLDVLRWPQVKREIA